MDLRLLVLPFTSYGSAAYTVDTNFMARAVNILPLVHCMFFPGQMYNAWEIDAEAKRVLEAVGIPEALLNRPVTAVGL